MMTFADSMTGRVLRRGDADYETARTERIWNELKPQRYPDYIAVPENTDDVITAVNFAREHGLQVSVRSGGHNFCGASLRDGGILLDLRHFNHCEIDAEARTARLGPALENGTLVEALEPLGLAFPVGHCASVTMGGYLLGGGFGWNIAQWGVACWSVLALEIVTADGRLIVADANHNQEFYWAARGMGGGFFGVVTGFSVALQTAPQVKRMASLLLPVEQAAAVGAWLRDTVPTLDPRVEVIAAAASAPPPLAAASPQLIVLAGVVFCDDATEANALLAPLTGCELPALHREPAADVSWEGLFEIMGRTLPTGKFMLGESQWVHGDPAELLERAAAGVAAAPSPLSSIMCVVLPPLPPDMQLPDTAFSMVGPVSVMTYTVWDDADAESENRAWHSAMAEGFAPQLIGYYLNEANIAAGPDRAERAFAPPVWQRLAELKAKHDPTGVFHWYLGCEVGAAVSK